jgi:hypothetical protein
MKKSQAGEVRNLLNQASAAPGVAQDQHVPVEAGGPKARFQIMNASYRLPL